ncbi:MAG TPA: glycosyltransferase family A protein [Candidatus Binatus sp.]|jgi:glycosyltransferase involved in cell wall biosynthesis|nr:glycosyltransferase family A protein [Candidatus Binatus sp.]
MNEAAVRVSVVVPVFDAGRQLEQALESVTAQTYDNREVVVVDDGSTDPITARVLAVAASRPGITVHRTPNRGPALARNLAIERSVGAYILPLDADDYLAPRFLELTVPVLDAEPDVGVVYTWVGLVGAHDGVWKPGAFALPDLLSCNTIHVTALFRRELWVDVGGYDARFAENNEDWDLWLSAAARGWKGHCVPEVLCYHRRGPASRGARASAPGISTRLMRTMVAKHRALYEAHLEEAFGGMFERLVATNASLESLYYHPVLRKIRRLRTRLGWVRGTKT